MLKPLLKKAIPLLTMIPLLGSCSLFQPKTKVIEYDEEVKLHDGSMIWVHIKRHYGRSSGCEISNCFQGYEKGWGAKEVEISWDTGFPNVGRKSVFFDHVVEIISYYDGKWFVGGIASNRQDNINDSINCLKVGNQIGYGGCILVLDSMGKYTKPSLEYMNNFYQKNLANILSPYSIEYIEMPPTFLNSKKIGWDEKLKIQQNRPQEGQLINKQLFKSGVINYE